MAPLVLLFASQPFLPTVLKQTPAVMHYPAAIWAAWIGGLFPGIFVTLVCSAYSIFFLRPHLLLHPLEDAPGTLRSLMFLSTSLFFTFLITAMQRGLQKAEEAIRIRDEFLSVASHELKTPITSLFLQTQLREKKAARAAKNGEAFSAEELHRMAKSNLRELTRLNQLVENMLDVTRIARGKRPFHPEEADLSLTISEAVDRFRETSRADIQAEIAPNISGKFDRLQIEQIFSNLLTNAVKYGHGKPVRVTLTRKDESTARLEVADQGDGIAPEARHKIFEKFERLDHNSQVSGLGLGLYICRELTKRQGGSIDFESTVGQGSTFRVDLPLQPPA